MHPDAHHQKKLQPMKYFCLSTTVLAFALAGCGKQAKIDAAKLDTLLSTGRLDTVIMVDRSRTNILTGEAAQKYIGGLNSTNRLKAASSKVQEDWSVTLLRNTNPVCVLTRFENRTWEYGEYCFRTKTSQ
jgi:hypothetical protein